MNRLQSCLLTTALLVFAPIASAQVPNSNPGIGNNGSTGTTNPSDTTGTSTSKPAGESSTPQADAAAKKDVQAIKKAKGKKAVKTDTSSSATPAEVKSTGSGYTK